MLSSKIRKCHLTSYFIGILLAQEHKLGTFRIKANSSPMSVLEEKESEDQMKAGQRVSTFPGWFFSDKCSSTYICPDLDWVNNPEVKTNAVILTTLKSKFNLFSVIGNRWVRNISLVTIRNIDLILTAISRSTCKVNNDCHEGTWPDYWLSLLHTCQPTNRRLYRVIKHCFNKNYVYISHTLGVISFIA